MIRLLLSVFLMFTTTGLIFAFEGIQTVTSQNGQASTLSNVPNARQIQFQRVDSAETGLELGLPIAREVTDPIRPWLLWLIVVEFISIGIVRFIFPPLLSAISRNIINYNIALQSFRHNEKEPTAVDILLRINSLVTFSLAISLSLQYYFEFTFNPSLILTVASFLLAFYLFRKLVKNIIGSVFRFGEVLQFANFYSDFLLKGLGMVSFPVVLIFLFGNSILQGIAFYLFILIISIFITARLLRGLKAGASLFLSNAFHFILYICTLEIVPFLLICKVFVMYYRSV